MKRILITALKFLATGTVSLFMAACYGVMYSVRHLTVRDPDSNPIPGLNVTELERGIQHYDPVQTDAQGEVMLFVDWEGEDSVARIEDMDGAENGGDFQTMDVPLNGDVDVAVTVLPKP